MDRLYAYAHQTIDVLFNKNSDNFVVEEIPLYEFSGEGEHMILFVRKKNLSTNEMIGQFARYLNIKNRDIGYAGLKDKHEIIAKLLEYREVYKLYSTYIEPLLKLAREDKFGRIHTSFVQTGTATGRLSSKDPNLQNIPVRSTLGKEVRDAF